MKNTLSLNTAFTQLEALAQTFQGFENLLLDFKKWSNTKASIYACAYCQKFNISAEGQTVAEVLQLLELRYRHTLLTHSERKDLPELVFADEPEELVFEAKTPYEF